MTIRLTEEVQAYLEAEAGARGFGSGEDFVQSLVTDCFDRRNAALIALLDEAENEPLLTGSLDEIIAGVEERGRLRSS